MMTAMVRIVVCLSIWISVSQVNSLYVPQKMNKTIMDILHFYKYSRNDIYDGNAVFSREPLNGKPETKMVYLSGVLGAYEKLIEHMLKQLPTPSPQIAGREEKLVSCFTDTPGATRSAGPVSNEDVRPKLMCILKKIQDLKTHYYGEQERFLDGLQALKHIKMDNLKVQKKALWELQGLFEEASSVAEHIRMKRRRRRQARNKKHLRG